jgi:hypothetical protein
MTQTVFAPPGWIIPISRSGCQQWRRSGRDSGIGHRLCARRLPAPMPGSLHSLLPSPRRPPCPGPFGVPDISCPRDPGSGDPGLCCWTPSASFESATRSPTARGSCERSAGTNLGVRPVSGSRRSRSGGGGREGGPEGALPESSAASDPRLCGPPGPHFPIRGRLLHPWYRRRSEDRHARRRAAVWHHVPVPSPFRARIWRRGPATSRRPGDVRPIGASRGCARHREAR